MADEHLFYLIEPAEAEPPNSTAERYTIEVWRPSLTSLRPRGFALLPFGVWWLLHYLRVFTNRGYALVAIYDGDHLVHRTCVFPRYYRFAFMQPGDLQLGDIWTAESHRGRGLGRLGLMAAIGSASTHQRWWYVVEPDNSASIRLAEKVGFRLHGRGIRTAPAGLRPLGRFVLTETTSQTSATSPPMAA